MRGWSDPDSGLWIVLSGLFILVVAVFMLYANYATFEAPKDLTTASTIVTAYFVQAIVKKMARNKQKDKE